MDTQSILYTPLVAILLWLSYQDIKERMIYTWIPVVGTLLGMFLNIYLYSTNHNIKLMQINLGVSIGFFSLWFFNFMYRQIKNTEENAIGTGDMFTFAMIGAFLGIQALYIVLLVACISALVFVGAYRVLKYEKSLKTLPFVPFLTLGTATFVIWKEFVCKT